MQDRGAGPQACRHAIWFAAASCLHGIGLYPTIPARCKEGHLGSNGTSRSAVGVMVFAGGLLALAPSAGAQVATKPVVAHLALAWADPIHVLKEDFEAGYLLSGGATFHVDPTLPIGMRVD